MAALFNLYLGFSGLSVIAVLVFCADVISKWYRSRKQCLVEVLASPENKCLQVQNMQSNKVTTSSVQQTQVVENSAMFAMKQEILLLRKEFREAMAYMTKMNDQVCQWKKEQENSMI